MKKKMIYKEGQKVLLKANKKEGWKEETCTIIDYEGKDMYSVENDEIGVFEIDANQIKKVVDKVS